MTVGQRPAPASPRVIFPRRIDFDPGREEILPFQAGYTGGFEPAGQLITEEFHDFIDTDASGDGD
jgi:hypothetical protein